jgi:hypothetical protein
LVPSPAGLMTILYCLITPGVVQLFPTLVLTAKLLLALASTVILGSESHGTHDYILLSDGSGSLQNNSCPVPTGPPYITLAWAT